MPDSTDPQRRSKSSQISEALVRVVRELTGRGPVSCRVTMDSNAIFAVMYDTLTKGEQTLVDHDHAEEVLALRRGLQTVAGPALVAEVERITGRRVETFMSTNHGAPDRAVEVFLLEGACDPK